MTIRGAMLALPALLESVSIEQPVEARIKKAFPYQPPSNVTLPDVPAAAASWTLTGFQPAVDLLITVYAIRVQVFVGEITTENDRLADACTALWEAIVAAWAADTTLSNTLTGSTIRGNQPTLAVLERGNKSYLGLDFFIDAELKEAIAFG